LGIPKHLAITGIILFFTLINALGAYITGKTEDALVIFKLIALSLVALAGLVSLKNFDIISYFLPSQNILNVLVGGMIIFLAYEGFELIANASTEAKNLKDIPKAFYASITFVTILYILIAIVTVSALPVQQVVKAKDYALAAVAQPILGKLGFVLISIAALASTASAINATLFGTVGISYIISKYGQLPEALERKVWKQAYEGLIIISLISILSANLLNLEEISLIGSAGFLLIFFSVNLAGFILRKQAKRN
jgi:amino acid transporter